MQCVSELVAKIDHSIDIYTASIMPANIKAESYPALNRIEREPMHDKVYLEMKTALMEARFEPGTQLSLRELAKVFGVSVAPVRAALLRLVAEKAVLQKSTTTGNFYVPSLSRDEFEEIVELRALLEGNAAAQAASRISADELAALQNLADDLARASEEGDSDTYLEANRSFKFGVVSAARAPVLMDLIEALWIRIGPLLHHYGRDMKHQGETDYYAEVVGALRDKDSEAARKYMEKDIIEGAAFIRKTAEF